MVPKREMGGRAELDLGGPPPQGPRGLGYKATGSFAGRPRPEVNARQRDAPSGAKGVWMFDSLSEKLGGILDQLTRRGALTSGDVDAALREVRRARLEADVALDVARSFVDKVRERAVGVEVLRSVTPGQMVVKIVHDQLIETLGSDTQQIDLNAPAPVPVMLVGLQGSGKTTTAAKLAKRLAAQTKRKVLMASLDTRRPAAMEQLAVLGRQTETDTLPIVAGQSPTQIARGALDAGRLGGYA